MNPVQHSFAQAVTSGCLVNPASFGRYGISARSTRHRAHISTVDGQRDIGGSHLAAGGRRGEPRAHNAGDALASVATASRRISPSPWPL
jgi:hypothetical protein